MCAHLCVHIYVWEVSMYIHAPISQLCPLKGPKKQKQKTKNLMAISTSSVQILMSKPYPTEKTQGSSKKCLITGLG